MTTHPYARLEEREEAIRADERSKWLTYVTCKIKMFQERLETSSVFDPDNDIEGLQGMIVSLDLLRLALEKPLCVRCGEAWDDHELETDPPRSPRCQDGYKAPEEADQEEGKRT